MATKEELSVTVGMLRSEIASDGGKTYFALAACGERSGYFARQDQRQGYERRT